MPANIIPVPPPEPAAAPDKLLLDIPDLAGMLNLSVRHLRRLDACGDIPGRVEAGRRVLFQAEVIRDWVRAGLPDRDRWAALQKRSLGTERGRR